MKGSDERADGLIEEFFRLNRKYDDVELQLVEAAMFVEDAFDLRITDDDLCRDALGTEEAMKRLVRARQEN